MTPTHATTNHRKSNSLTRPARKRTPATSRRGISMTEMLVALAISAMLLTAVTVALNASFYAYANAAESASTNSSVRLVMQRMMRLIRNAHLHDAYDPVESVSLLPEASVYSVGLQMLDQDGKLIRVWWEANESYSDDLVGDLWYGEGADVQPLLERVTAQVHEDEPYVFVLNSRDSPEGLLLSRATLDLSVQPGADATLSLESARGKSAAVRLVASTMPRRNLD